MISVAGKMLGGTGGFRFWDFVDSVSRDHVGPFVSLLSHPLTIFVCPLLICAGVWPPQLMAPAPLCLSSQGLWSPVPQPLVSSPHCSTSPVAFRPAQGPLGLLACPLLSLHLWAMPWGSQGSHRTEGEALVSFDVWCLMFDVLMPYVWRLRSLP